MPQKRLKYQLSLKNIDAILQIPDKVTTISTGKNSNNTEKEGTKKVPLPYKKASTTSQIKLSQNKGAKSKENSPEALLGDIIPETKRIPKSLK